MTARPAIENAPNTNLRQPGSAESADATPSGPVVLRGAQCAGCVTTESCAQPRRPIHPRALPRACCERREKGRGFSAGGWPLGHGRPPSISAVDPVSSCSSIQSLTRRRQVRSSLRRRRRRWRREAAALRKMHIPPASSLTRALARTRPRCVANGLLRPELGVREEGSQTPCAGSILVRGMVSLPADTS